MDGRIVSPYHVEVSEERLRRQNRARPTAVPDEVIDALLKRWEVPDRTEAHHVEWLVAD